MIRWLDIDDSLEVDGNWGIDEIKSFYELG